MWIAKSRSGRGFGKVSSFLLALAIGVAIRSGKIAFYSRPGLDPWSSKTSTYQENGVRLVFGEIGARNPPRPKTNLTPFSASRKPALATHLRQALRFQILRRPHLHRRARAAGGRRGSQRLRQVERDRRGALGAG